MKKEFIICTIVIVAVITLNAITGNYTKDSVLIIKEELDSVKVEIEQRGEKNRIIEKVSKVKEKWDNRYNKLAYYIEHDELEKVELYLVGMDSNIKLEEYAQAMEELNKCIYILEHLEDKYSFNLKNIF